MRMLVTRPEPEATETAAKLRALDLDPIVCPLLRFHTLPTSLPEPKGFAAMALSSANALRALAVRGELEAFRKLRVFAVGDRTAAAARASGFVHVESAGGALSDLAEQLAHARLTGPVFYPAARDQSGDLAKSLAPYGVMVVTARVYEMTAVDRVPAEIVQQLDEGGIGAALFYSRRTAETFVACVGKLLGRRAKARLGVLCLSETIAEPLIGAHFVRVGLADYPSEEAMMGLCLSFARDQNAP